MNITILASIKALLAAILALMSSPNITSNIQDQLNLIVNQTAIIVSEIATMPAPTIDNASTTPSLPITEPTSNPIGTFDANTTFAPTSTTPTSTTAIPETTPATTTVSMATTTPQKEKNDDLIKFVSVDPRTTSTFFEAMTRNLPELYLTTSSLKINGQTFPMTIVPSYQAMTQINLPNQDAGLTTGEYKFSIYVETATQTGEAEGTVSIP